MTELFEEKDLKAFEEVEGEQLGEIEYTEESVELEVEFEIPEPEEVQLADQVEEPPAVSNTDYERIVNQVVAGEWGKGQDRRQRLEAAGIDHVAVQKELVRRMNHR